MKTFFALIFAMIIIGCGNQVTSPATTKIPATATLRADSIVIATAEVDIAMSDDELTINFKDGLYGYYLQDEQVPKLIYIGNVGNTFDGCYVQDMQCLINRPSALYPAEPVLVPGLIYVQQVTPDWLILRLKVFDASSGQYIDTYSGANIGLVRTATITLAQELP